MVGAVSLVGAHTHTHTHMCAHAGLGYASFSKFSTLFFGDTFMPSKGMWTRISQRVAGAMVDVANVSMERARQLVAAAFLKSGKLATIAMDMGWSTRGWHARFGSMPIIVSGLDVIIDHIVLCKTSTVGDALKMQGNYMGSSKGMEGRAVNLTLGRLKAAVADLQLLTMGLHLLAMRY